MAESGKQPDGRRSVLFIVRGDETVPSCRFRAFQYREPLRKIGVETGYVILERSKNPFKQILFHLKLIFALKRHRVVIFQKLLEPWRLAFLKAFNQNLYYDFDDAMYAAEDGAKFPATVRAAPHVLAGNAILAGHARPFNPDIFLLPTVVPVPEWDPVEESSRPAFILSWIGTFGNLPYLDPLLEVLDKWHARNPGFTLRILTNKPELVPKNPWIEAVHWSREREDPEFRNCDVGLMPVPDTEWGAGKCACKALQYLSHGKPVIASPVGINRELFADATFGTLAGPPEEWIKALESYRSHPRMRIEAGRLGHAFVRENFDVNIWAGKLALHLFRTGTEKGAP